METLLSKPLTTKKGVCHLKAVNSDYLDTTHLADNVHDGLYKNK